MSEQPYLNHVLNDPEDVAAMLAAIDAMHDPQGRSFCLGCFSMWPCSTHMILHPEG